MVNSCSGELEAKILEILEKNSGAHFFCDEMPIGVDGVSEEFLIDFSNKVSKDGFLWIAANSNSTSSSLLKRGEILHLIINSFFVVNKKSLLNLTFISKSISMKAVNQCVVLKLLTFTTKLLILVVIQNMLCCYLRIHTLCYLA